MYWLLKTEPSEYAFEDLVREKTTLWEGVKNPLALRHLGSMTVGDDGAAVLLTFPARNRIVAVTRP